MAGTIESLMTKMARAQAQAQASPPAASPAPAPALHDRAIGALLADARGLDAQAVERILRYQREQGVRFGEAAVALGEVAPEDVLAALAQQFHYPCAVGEGRHRSPELVALNQPFAAQAEVFRAIRGQIAMRLYRDGEPRRALAVISPQTQDGKSYFAANLAVSLAQLGGRTLLVDADLRGPRQHAIFDVPNPVGLSAILSGRSEARVIHQVERVSNLFLLTAGAVPPNPVELLERPAFGLLMRELAKKFDHVIVDTSAGLHGADAGIVAARCGAALVLARQHESRVAALQELTDRLDGAATLLVGCILNEH